MYDGDSGPIARTVSIPERPAQGSNEKAAGRQAMKIVRWKSGIRHVSRDGGIKTACGHLVPERATVTRETPDWHEYTNCFNCAYRLWPEHGPAGYLKPHSSSGFPIRKACPHGYRAEGCVRCTPRAAQNWPCPKGCTDPLDHNPISRYTKCTISPPRKPSGPDGRCVDGCESEDRAMHRANPGLHFDLADSASMYCYHCSEPVCLGCQSAPADHSSPICDQCARY
jgi:hypothetical protein